MCDACARLHRTFAGIIPESPGTWPELLRPGNEATYIRWRRLPRHDKLVLGGIDNARLAQVEVQLARRGL